MRKIVYLFIIFFTIASCVEKHQDAPTTIIVEDEASVNADSFAVSTAESVPMLMLDSTVAERRRRMAMELDYYLSRHDVGDDGFDMVARYAEKGDSVFASFKPQGLLHPTSLVKFKSVPRQGWGIQKDACGRIIIGTWAQDTLTFGIRISKTGIYAGQFDRHLQASGHGSQRMADGSYYEGHFAYDQRNGFGFSISVDHLHAGTWKNDRFVGERMTYNTDRIYGIDISRYQHEQGRRRFAINWGKMDITSLGKKNTLPDDAKPAVSFVYIKASEGLTIRNRYFMGDYQAARKLKLPVGAYHFFSTKQSGRLQANYFLKTGRFLVGDLPPVLDVEPTDARIMQMGGPEALFREIRAWIAVVEKQLHVKPILYVSQNFVHKYFDLAPDLKENYHVWIARYGEYRPDVHLAIWQLSADGHVDGIQGPVDINVFNGYAGQWQEFLNNETIQRIN